MSIEHPHTVLVDDENVAKNIVENKNEISNSVIVVITNNELCSKTIK
ncbi:hypothetical protein PULV_a2569 [Pseudoalteromonas ulvae UL12]|nr:hypothetical protein [Pseudoalteromonas ulvae UL12]